VDVNGKQVKITTDHIKSKLVVIADANIGLVTELWMLGYL